MVKSADSPWHLPQSLWSSQLTVPGTHCSPCGQVSWQSPAPIAVLVIKSADSPRHLPQSLWSSQLTVPGTHRSPCVPCPHGRSLGSVYVNMSSRGWSQSWYHMFTHCLSLSTTCLSLSQSHKESHVYHCLSTSTYCLGVQVANVNCAADLLHFSSIQSRWQGRILW